jgi:hypothetical protein
MRVRRPHPRMSTSALTGEEAPTGRANARPMIKSAPSRRMQPQHSRNTPPHSRGAIRPSCARSTPSQNRGRRESRVRGAPAASRVEKTRELVTTGSPEHPAFPAQWFYGLFRALPGDRAFLSPSSGAVSCAELERQRRGVRTTRLRRPRQRRSSKAHPCPPHPVPTSVTIAKRPSSGTGWREIWK